MVMRYLGSMVNVVASSLGLVTLVICVLVGLGWPAIPIVIGVYLLSALVAWFILPSYPVEPDSGKVKPRRAA